MNPANLSEGDLYEVNFFGDWFPCRFVRAIELVRPGGRITHMYQFKHTGERRSLETFKLWGKDIATQVREIHRSL